MRPLLTALTCLMLFATPVVAGDFEDGVAAYKAGDKQKAYRLWGPLKNEAQDAWFVGDYAKALRLNRKLAAQGHAWAQYQLTIMYDLGQGVPENDTKAVGWHLRRLTITGRI